MRLFKGLLRGHIINNNLNKGMYLTVLNLFRFGFILMQSKSQFDIDFSISFWKFGVHSHFTKGESNLCQDKSNHKNQ